MHCPSETSRFYICTESFVVPFWFFFGCSNSPNLGSRPSQRMARHRNWVFCPRIARWRISYHQCEGQNKTVMKNQHYQTLVSQFALLISSFNRPSLELSSTPSVASGSPSVAFGTSLGYSGQHRNTTWYCFLKMGKSSKRHKLFFGDVVPTCTLAKQLKIVADYPNSHQVGSSL